MPWLRLDDKFWRNPKMRSISAGARGIWVDAASYCADTPEPTGYLTEADIKVLTNGRLGRRYVDELVSANCWEAVNGGYLIHDFDKYLDRGSRDRCRAWRDRKRQEVVTSPKRLGDVTRNVTGASPRATGLGDKEEVLVIPGPEPGPEPGPAEVMENPAFQGLAIRIIEWFCDQRGWQAVPADRLKRERNRGYAIAQLQIPEPQLWDELNRIWAGAKEKPQTLGYFWQPLQILESQTFKAADFRQPGMGPVRLGDILPKVTH